MLISEEEKKDMTAISSVLASKNKGVYRVDLYLTGLI